MRHCLFLLLLIAAAPVLAEPAAAKSASTIEPGEAIDYAPLAFFPQRWKEQGVDTQMTPWRGEEVVFLTTSPDFDPRVMGGLLEKLDGGWRHYANLIGKQPSRSRVVAGLPVLAAVPGSRLTCGYGCGYVGATGIELSAFYDRDYASITADPRAIPDYYFYEMGRNYFVFGDRHSCFTTGFAVFMRYVCLDHLDLKSDDATREAIERAEAIYRKSNKPFLPTFTNAAGLSEKQPRLKDKQGRAIGLSDQPVMYASAMLRLRREYAEKHGGDGDQFVGEFFKQLLLCPEFDPNDKQGATRQTINWLVAASAAAGEDLSPIFVDEWRMPLRPNQRKTIANIRWAKKPKVNMIMGRLRGR